MNVTRAHCFCLRTAPALGDCVRVLLAFADKAIGFTLLCDDKASLAVLWGWVGCSFIPGCFALPKALTPVQMEIILLFISPNFWTPSFSHTSRLLGHVGMCFAYSRLNCSLVCGYSLTRLAVVCRIPEYQLHWVAGNEKTSKELVEPRA